MNESISQMYERLYLEATAAEKYYQTKLTLASVNRDEKGEEGREDWGDFTDDELLLGEAISQGRKRPLNDPAPAEGKAGINDASRRH